MGLIREAMRVPRFDGQEVDAEACAIRLLDGSGIGIAVSYESMTRLVFGSRAISGTPRGVRFDEKRGWLELRPPACAPEDEGLIPLTAIAAIMPLYPEDIEAAEADLTEEELAQLDAEGSDPYGPANGNGAGGNGTG